MEKTLMEYKLGDSIESYAMVKASEVKTASNGNSFLSLTITDKSGDVKGKPIWNVTAEVAEVYKPGTIIQFKSTTRH